MNITVTVTSRENHAFNVDLYARSGEQASIAARHAEAFAALHSDDELLALDYIRTPIPSPALYLAA